MPPSCALSGSTPSTRRIRYDAPVSTMMNGVNRTRKKPNGRDNRRATFSALEITYSLGTISPATMWTHVMIR